MAAASGSVGHLANDLRVKLEKSLFIGFDISDESDIIPKPTSSSALPEKLLLCVSIKEEKMKRSAVKAKGAVDDDDGEDDDDDDPKKTVQGSSRVICLTSKSMHSYTKKSAA